MRSSYRDVKDDILNNITSGIWPPGTAIASEVELAAQYGCARATVNRAMRELVEEGLIERRRKAGSRVRKAPVRQARFDIPIIGQEITDRGARYKYALIDQKTGLVPDWLRPRLQLADDAKMLHMTCMHYADNTPYQFEDRWINLEALPEAETTDFDQIGPNEWLVKKVPFTDVEASFSAQAADDTLAAHLDCLPRDPLFHVERSTWREGTALTYVRLYFASGYRMSTSY